MPAQPECCTKKIFFKFYVEAVCLVAAVAVVIGVLNQRRLYVHKVETVSAEAASVRIALVLSTSSPP